MKPLRVGVLASGAGTTLQALLDAQIGGDFTVVLAISNNSDSGAMKRATQAHVPTLHLSGVTHPDAAISDAAMADALTAADAELVVTAGYLKLVGPATLRRFAGRIINTHPSLLPAHGGQGMYGDRVHAAVLSAGDAVSGPTVHLVTDDYDQGPVVAQAQVQVFAEDSVESLRLRVQQAEVALLLDVVSGFARDRSSLPSASLKLA